MQTTRQKVLKELAGWTPDGQWDSWLVEVKSSTHTARDLRAILVTLAYAATLDPANEPVCVLVDSRMTPDRLQRELALFCSVIGPGIGSRIHIVTRHSSGRFTNLPGGLLVTWLEDLVQRKLTSPDSNRKGASPYTVLGLLILNWLQHATPQTTDALCRAAGASYTTLH